MPSWLVVPIVAVVAITVLALVWWSSGRARVGARDRDSMMTPEQRARLDYNRIETMRNRDGMGPI